MNDFRKLRVWQLAHSVALTAYRATQNFPSIERFGLTSQIRRAAASIPANIAEGLGRHTDRDQARFLQIAFGSACELEYELLLAHDLKLVPLESYQPLNESVISVKRMLAGLIRRTRN